MSSVCVRVPWPALVLFAAACASGESDTGPDGGGSDAGAGDSRHQPSDGPGLPPGPAIYVARPPLGQPTAPGTQAQPVATIGRGIELAAQMSPGAHVVVAGGTYNESVTLRSGISLFGGFDPNASWMPSSSSVSTIRGDETAVLAMGLTDETHVEGFTIRSADATSAAGASSYGIRIL